jgi:hypothetical protein
VTATEVSVADPTPSIYWKAHCGWRFGLVEHVRGPPVLVVWQRICGTCYPARRA